MSNRLLAICTPVPAGFIFCSEFRRSEFRKAPFALYGASIEEVRHFLGKELPRLAGVILIPGAPFCAEAIAPHVTQITIMPSLASQLRGFVEPLLAQLEKQLACEDQCAFLKLENDRLELNAQRASEEFSHFRHNLLYEVAGRRETLDALRLKNFVFDASLAANSIADLQGNLTEANAMFLKLWGYSSKRAVLGKPIMDFLHDPREAACILKAIDETGQWEGDYTAKKQDGSTFIAHGMATTLRSETNQTIGYQSSVIDVTERKRAEGELLKAQKLTSVGLLAGGIAHDFNNILMGLFGYISLAKKTLPPDNPALMHLEKAEMAMTRASRLTNQLLTFAKGGDPITEEVGLGSVIEEVARFDLTGSNVKLVYQQMEGLWLAKADKEQIQQVISNLTINARQAMPNSGHLYITLENAVIRENATPFLRPGNYLRITVRDEGTGIEPDTIGRIFDPYFTTKQTGNGLGLSISYSIIQKHGGHIGVSSEPGKGTTFTIHIPASDTPAIPIQTSVVNTPPPFKQAHRILVLDDEEFIRMLIPRWLKPVNCIVTACEEGRHAVDLYKHAREAGTPFDLLLLDLTIPGGMGGYEVFREIQSYDPSVKAVVSSGYADGPIMSDHAAYGFKGILVKPYTEERLLALVAHALA